MLVLLEDRPRVIVDHDGGFGDEVVVVNVSVVLHLELRVELQLGR